MTASPATDAPASAGKKPIGLFSAMAWLTGVFCVGQAIGTAVVFLFTSAGFLPGNDFRDLVSNGAVLSAGFVIAFPFQLSVLVLGASRHLEGVPRILGLDRRPSVRMILIAMAALAVFLFVNDAITYLRGRTLVSQFQLDSYASARAGGIWGLVLMWTAFTVCAPVVEELMFRGLGYTGFKTRLGKPLAMAILTAVWASLHIQYDWFGIAEVAAAGALFSYARIRSGSTWIPILMHMTMNAWSTLETVYIAARSGIA